MKNKFIFFLIYLFLNNFAFAEGFKFETSEIESEDKKNRMIRMATNSAIQMMISKIQSDIPVSDDN